MKDAGASVRAATFDVTLLDIEGREQGFQRNRSLEELRYSIRRRLEDAAERQHSIVIRPRSMATLLIQLDDFTAEKADLVAPSWGQEGDSSAAGSRRPPTCGAPS